MTYLGFQLLAVVQTSEAHINFIRIKKCTSGEIIAVTLPSIIV